MLLILQLPRTLAQGISLAVAVCLASCATPTRDKPFADPEPDGRAAQAKNAPLDQEEGYSFWDDHGGKGQLRVTIDLSEQTAYFYRGDKKIGRSRVATGLPGHSTPRGSFTILEKQFDKRSNLYGAMLNASGQIVNDDADSRRDSPPPGGRFEGAAMPYWMRLTPGGVGMHHGPIPNPGSRASHGCIRMPQSMAQALFDNAPLGTPVKIVE
jgi:lipoprotein-anchoring transpeptidase ErfK/SrfK